jgi:hypothetical protein
MGGASMAERPTIQGIAMKTKGLLLSALILTAVGLGAAFDAGSAPALTINSFGATPSDTQAGGHPDVVFSYSGESRTAPATTNRCQCNDLRNLELSLPAGFIGNPHVTPRCRASEFARNACSADSQVGVITYTIELGGEFALTFTNEAIYNTLPRPTQAGLISVKLLPDLQGIPLYTVLSGRTGSDYGLDARTEGLQRELPIINFTYTLWGVPASDAHNSLRYFINSQEEKIYGASSSPLAPFLQNPGLCNAALSTTAHVEGYDNSTSSAESAWPQMTGCDQLTFNPSLSAKPTTTEADAPSGVDVDLIVPQLVSPTFPSPSEIKAATITFPEGFSLNPSAADGKTSCSDAAANFGTEDEAHCPEYSKIGSATVDSSALPQPIPGALYLGDPLPGDRYRLILTADGFATHIKIAGRVEVDPQTGQLVNVFPNLPQAPLSEFNVHIFGSERGVLATPTQCGTYEVKSTFVPWTEELPTQSSTQFFTIDQGPGGAPCPGPVRHFSPSFAASSTSNAAGSHTPFMVEIGRRDGDQTLSGVKVTTPPGFAATLAGIPYCPESAIAAAADASYLGLTEISTPSCPPASQIGTAIAGAGAGSHQVYLDGKVYLAGPYKGSPLSLAVVTPAVSGPYDLGNVVVRAAISVNPVTAQVSTTSDPLPQIFQGIPLRLRTVLIKLDRPNFALNPTNCDKFAVDALLTGDQGGQASLGSPYQVANCANLPFAPKLSLHMSGGVRRRGHPAIHAVLTAAPGEANLRKVSVTLPKGALLDNAHIDTICTRPNFAKNTCPPGSRVGSATVYSPLLNQPLTGGAYLRASSKDLPDLVLDLEGQVDFEAAARIDAVKGRLRSSFESTPDIPVSRVEVDLLGGSKGLVQNSETLCGNTKKATVKMTGQNGIQINLKPKLQVTCSGQARHKRHGR